MSCLALALQPVQGADLLLQTREWFPPARALLASSDFRAVRKAQTSGRRDGDGTDPGLGDEALAASGGQVVVGKESKHRVVYRLVNSIYVLGITGVDQDTLAGNVFECTSIVNQVVSVLVAACKGVDVTPDKVHRKYTEIYMALDVVLRGITSARLAAILASIHGESIAQMVMSVTDAENRSRGAESWIQVKGHSIEHLANVEILSNATFELPEETLAAGDEVATAMAPTLQTPAAPAIEQRPAEKQPAENEDPFAASEKLNRPEELAGDFKKSKETVPDVVAALAELEIPALAPRPTAESMFIGVEGFEGNYGGLDFEQGDTMFGGAFEGLSDAFGGGLDASEFGATPEIVSSKGLGGLEELESKGTGTAPADQPAKVLAITDAEGALNADKTLAAKMPLLYLSEEIHAEFRGSKLKRIGLQGCLHLRTVPPNSSGGQDTAFSLRLEGSAGIKKAVMRNTVLSSLEKGLFHVRTSSVQESFVILKYRLHPRFTPVPLRLRLVTRQSGSLISLMIQYVANPYLPGSLKNVSFIVRLPFAPSLLKMAPKGLLNRQNKELRWQIKEIQLQAPPGILRAQMPLDLEGEDTSTSGPQKLKLQASVEFSFSGQTLSGINILPAHGGTTEFYVGEHMYKTGNYFCA